MTDSPERRADALLERIARSLRTEIGPAVSEAYPKTQAFLAAVVLEKLAGQLRLEAEHEVQDAADIASLLDAEPFHAPDLPVSVSEAFEKLRSEGSSGALRDLVEALYDARGELGDDRFHALLGRVRVTLRARVGRMMEFSA